MFSLGSSRGKNTSMNSFGHFEQQGACSSVTSYARACHQLSQGRSLELDHARVQKATLEHSKVGGKKINGG